MNHFKNIIKWIVNIFTCILFLVLILVIYGKITVMFTEKNYPNYFGYTFFEVASGSMEPTLYVNDVILVKITKDNLKKDDIIAFEQGNAIITHRIVFIDGDTLTVKGDNNNTIDTPIKIDSVIGKSIKTYSKLGVWKKVFSEPKIIFAVFVTLLLFDFAISYSPEKKEKTKKEKKEVKITKIPSEEELRKVEKLLEVTRKIDIEEINDLLENKNLKLNKKEVVELKEKVSTVENITNDIEMIDVSDEIPKLTKKEKNFIEYTTRLDLNEIMKKIDNSLK